MNDAQFRSLTALLTTLTAMVCVTALALVFDGNLVYLAAGALMGLLVPSPAQAQAPPPAATGGP